jgi:hypothetical protein
MTDAVLSLGERGRFKAREFFGWVWHFKTLWIPFEKRAPKRGRVQMVPFMKLLKYSVRAFIAFSTTRRWG